MARSDDNNQISGKERSARRGPVAFAIVVVGLFLLISTSNAVPTAAASPPCVSRPVAGIMPRPGNAGATMSLTPEDAAVMDIPVVAGQRTLVYIRLVGTVLTPGDVSFSYEFNRVSGYAVGTNYVLECDTSPVASLSYDVGHFGGPATITIERPIYITEQTLVADFHLQSAGFASLAWEIETNPCGNGGWAC
jgi:hypothetical protein